jgi:hypothetical protein
MHKRISVDTLIKATTPKGCFKLVIGINISLSRQKHFPTVFPFAKTSNKIKQFNCAAV